MIDWNSVISKLSTGVDIVPNPDNWNIDTPGYNEILNSWKQANYNFNAIKWTNYYPETHFSKDVELELSNQLDINPLRSWISCINPGYTAPWHWDVDDNEEEYLLHGDIVRYSIFIQDGKPGQVFMLEDHAYYNQKCGTTVKWKDYKAWHAGANAGLTPKYMYHLLGVVNT